LPIYWNQLARSHDEHIAGTDDVDRLGCERVALNPMHHGRRSREQRRQLAACSCGCPRLELASCGKHERDHGSGEIFPNTERATEVQHSHDVDPGATTQQVTRKSWSAVPS
jgi:hypothetical protein